MKKETLDKIAKIERTEKILDRSVTCYSWIIGITIGALLAYIIDASI
ncbi:hypothetical protein SAMN05444362_10132 [Dysgonomonas macrotermitis]|uniref:Uncharacterized protein n=1 Tax=Dysgonomonas macrotermitis TaxID=1346286 RepID=A0A1M4SDK3_9BACT|nr:hypothetical protein SAMN05444362_10132 [Dysgonomonas macrotermitis]